MAGRCEIDDCDVFGKLRRGLCAKHYSRARKVGRPPPRKNQASSDECSIDGCANPYRARGYCVGHYTRWQVHGDALPDAPLGPRGFQSAESHPDWKGGDIGYQAWHVRLRQCDHGLLCDHCQFAEPTEWAFNWREVPRDQWRFDPFPYTTRFEDYLDLCTSCHRTFDWGRRAMNNAEKGNRRGIE